MRVVSAGVHAIRILAGKRQPRCFVYPRKPVDIRAQHDTLARLAAADNAEHARMIRKRLILDSQRFQILRDGLGGFYLLHGWLRMRVVISSSVYDIRFIGFRQFPNVFHCRISFSICILFGFPAFISTISNLSNLCPAGKCVSCESRPPASGSIRPRMRKSTRLQVQTGTGCFLRVISQMRLR